MDEIVIFLHKCAFIYLIMTKWKHVFRNSCQKKSLIYKNTEVHKTEFLVFLVNYLIYIVIWTVYQMNLGDPVKFYHTGCEVSVNWHLQLSTDVLWVLWGGLDRTHNDTRPVKSWPQIIVVAKGVAQVVSSKTLCIGLHSCFPPFWPVLLRNTWTLCFTFEISIAWCAPDIILKVLLKKSFFCHIRPENLQ